jgi:hypothetical protein
MLCGNDSVLGVLQPASANAGRCPSGLGKGVTGPVRALRRFSGPRYYLTYTFNLESGGIFFAVTGELLIMILSGISGGR